MAGAISDQTTVLSNLSLTGRFAASIPATALIPQVDNTIDLGSSSSGYRGIYTKTVSLQNLFGGSFFGVGLQIGSSSAASITAINAAVVPVVAFSCAANQSSTTTAQVNTLAVGDKVFLCPTSFISSGINVYSYASATSILAIVFSNASTAAQTPAAQSYLMISVRT